MTFGSKVPANTNQVKNLLSTSVIKGCVVSTSNVVPGVSADVNIENGILRFVDNFTDQALPNFKGDLVFPETNIIGLDISVNRSIIIDADLNVTTPVFVLDTPSERRERLQISLIVTDGSVITLQALGYDVTNNLLDHMRAVGPVTLEGLTIGPNGINLSINRAEGTEYNPFCANYPLDVQDPSTQPLALVSPVTFTLFFRDGVGGFVEIQGVSTITPSVFDDGSPGASPVLPNGVVNNNQAQIFRVYESSGIFALLYGQQTYISMSIAEDALLLEAFDIPDAVRGASFRGHIIIRGGAIDLSSPADATFFQVSSPFSSSRSTI